MTVEQKEKLSWTGYRFNTFLLCMTHGLLRDHVSTWWLAAVRKDRTKSSFSVILTHWAVQDDTRLCPALSKCQCVPHQHRSCFLAQEPNFCDNSIATINWDFLKQFWCAQNKSHSNKNVFNTGTFTRAAIFCNQIILHNPIYRVMS